MSPSNLALFSLNLSWLEILFVIVFAMIGALLYLAILFVAWKIMERMFRDERMENMGGKL